MRTLAVILLLIIGWLSHGYAQQSFGVAYYNVDELYDTIPSPTNEDREYRSQGAKHWSVERYLRKVQGVVQVIDSMAMPVVGLYGVESEQVVRDIASSSNGDYAYLYEEPKAANGLDFALLYKADVFYPKRTTVWRGVLCVEAEVYGKPLTVVLTHCSIALGVLYEQLVRREAHKNLILLGEPSKRGFAVLGLRDEMRRAVSSGRGNIFKDGRWQMRDRVASNMHTVSQCDVFIRDWLLDSSGAPVPTFRRNIYHGGNGRRLPIFIYFDEVFEN